MSNRITFGSLFTGIGGLDLGLERAGMVCKFQVEINEYATRVLERHWPNVKRWRDVADFITYATKLLGDGCVNNRGRHKKSPRAVPKPRDSACVETDLICGGFPCQPVSVAGARRGDADERWLWPLFRRVVELVQPRYVVIENVPGLLSANDGRLFGGILRDLACMGFDAEWGVLPASAFGAPHLRRRVFIVAYSASNGRREGRGESIADSNGTRLAKRQSKPRDARQKQSAIIGADWRTVEPTIRRGDYGTSDRVDRLRCLGNAVVPQAAEWIGRRIIGVQKQDGDQ